MIDVERVTERLEWTFASTMKNIPHEYTVKRLYDKAKKNDYEALFFYILENHYIKYFYGKPYMYCDIGGYTYWIMSDDINVSKIINRVRTERK